MKKIDKLKVYSAELIDIIEKLLSINPNSRPSAQEVQANYDENLHSFHSRFLAPRHAIL